MDGWMDRQADRWVGDGSTDEWTDGRTDSQVGRWMDGRPNRWKERWMGGLDRHSGGWMNKKMEAKMDGCYLQR